MKFNCRNDMNSTGNMTLTTPRSYLKEAIIVLLSSNIPMSGHFGESCLSVIYNSSKYDDCDLFPNEDEPGYLNLTHAPSFEMLFSLDMTIINMAVFLLVTLVILGQRRITSGCIKIFIGRRLHVAFAKFARTMSEEIFRKQSMISENGVRTDNYGLDPVVSSSISREDELSPHSSSNTELKG